jgi:ADP-heptose:LPS heptosyltransferase
MLNTALLCPQGLGDAFLLMILAHHCQKKGHQVTFYHEKPSLLIPLFPNMSFSSYPRLEDFETVFQPYDLVFVENDHSEKAWACLRLREQNTLNNLTFLFPKRYKNIAQPRDFIFDIQLPVATNLVQATKKLLQMPEADKSNGIICPQGIKRRYEKRVILHPTSQDPKRNWTKTQFLLLAKELTLQGFDPVFVVSHQEKEDWQEIALEGHSLYISSSLTELAHLLYESGYFIGNDSGIGHLASNIGVPTLTISGNPKRVRVWRPDFTMNHVVTPSITLPNFKGIGLRCRDLYWQNFVSVGKVLRNFKRLIAKQDSHVT